ncbi:hypothetical protein GDO81_025894 [Engystomops pustulosus]|uniref:Taste receptor type 2 n=1 Tax=Engystomops pustulosus TaxID=76066 RepID=A0AAV6ZLR9_ENGPU|nr:hypothetical protein GDO81_025894 [Engystomops pustulosus]
MTSYTEEETNVQYKVLLITSLMAITFGLVIHSIIIGVNVSDWWRGRSVTPVDHIVTSLGISMMCCQCILTLFHVFINLFLHVNVVIIDVVYNLCVLTSLWLTSLLSIVLCLKISNLHTRLFLYLRRMISHRTGATNNQTMANRFQDCMYINAMHTFTTGTFLPLLFYSISSVLLFVSLYHHTTRMKMSSNLSINLETYYSTMKLVSFTFMYNTVYLFSHITSLLYHHLYCSTSPWIHVVLDFLPVLHSSYLIYRTAKLRNQMSKVLHNVMDYLFQRKTTENIENTEIVDR